LSRKEKEEKEQKITSIDQKYSAKIFLQIMLMIIFSTGVFILAFFSVPT